MTDKEFLSYLNTILNRDTRYNNTYPYNVGYYDGNFITFDCWNLVKAICWSNGTIANNYTVGKYAVYVPDSGLGDWTGRQILDHCSDVSGNMSNMVPGEFLLYEGDSHAGVYVGDGNVIECTLGWGQNGVIISQIDSNGRSFFRGVQRGRWYRHGKLTTFVKYTDPYKVGDVVVIKDGAKVYGTDIYFASWVYGMPLTISQIEGDRVVVNTDTYVMGAVAMKDIMPYEAPPIEEPDPFHPGTPNENEPIPEPDVSDKTLLEKILETLQEILNFLKRVFTKGEKDG